MKAVITRNERIACPSCMSSDYKVYRRELDERERIILHCRCNMCNQDFHCKLDKRGNATID